MSDTSSISVPQLAAWLLRLAAHPRTSSLLSQDAFVFATWYAQAHLLVDWPDEVRKIQQAQRARKLGLEQALKLLNQLSNGVAQRPSLSRARELLEGFAVHEWVLGHFSELATRVEDSKKLIDKLSAADLQRLPLQSSGLALWEAARALRLTQLETDILCFALLCTASGELRELVSQFTENRWTADKLWTVLFEASREDLEKALKPQSGLRLSGLLTPSGYVGVPVTVSPFWVQALLSTTPLSQRLLEPLKERRSSGTPARLLEEDLKLACCVVRNDKGLPGVNLLLYGASRLDKQQLLRAVVHAAGRTAWQVAAMDEASYAERPSLVYLAQRVLVAHDALGVLVVDRPADALSTAPPLFLRQLFGIDFDPAEVAPFDENLLSTNEAPTIWLASDVAMLPDETVSRFVFHAPLKKADRKERTEQLQTLLDDFRLTKHAREEILKLDGVSAAQVEAAMKAAALAGYSGRRERDAVVVQAIKRSQRALSRDVTAKMKPSVTQYSLKYLNTAGRFGPEDILRCLKHRPKGALVFYGLPGTGKTQFVEYMAAELGMPLVSKRASDLLSKWLGESEKNIAAAFEEAASEDAILLLDEGDSFLRDRSLARDAWQVTQVNELLQHIERFDGIVVVCTNLFEGLDAAALRRFTFKLEFHELSAEQRWEMFQVETGLKGKLTTLERQTRDDWFERLCLMPKLTAGDFATVKRQCDMLGTTLTPEEWLTQLELECAVKRRSTEDRRMVG